VWKSGEWFRDPEWNAQSQERALSAAMARLLATDLAKLTVFLAGGDDHIFGVYDPEGRPRPAAAVVEDYLRLALDGDRRLDVSLQGADETAVEGVYAAASTHGDGSATILLNPVEAPALQPHVPAPDSEFAAAEAPSWTTFWGKTEWTGTAAKVVPDAGRARCGFYRKTVLDPTRFPELEVSAPEAAGPWTLLLKFGDGDDPVVLSNDGPGVFRTEYASKLKNRTPRPVEISFRAAGALTLDQLRFIAPTAGARADAQLPVTVAFPLPGGDAWEAAATTGGHDIRVDLAVHGDAPQHWAEAKLALTGRTLVRVTRKREDRGK
jgi:hypothetical protein